MQIGNKILELRKQQNLSQEQLADKMGVARQTISKWELGETSPDLEQSKRLSQIFNLSLDELTNNNIKDILIDKVNNTEKMTKTIINILKIILIIIVMIVIILISILFFRDYFSVSPVSQGQGMNCQIDGETYTYEVWTNYQEPQDIISFNTNDKNLKINFKDYNTIHWLLDAIKKDVENRGGECNIPYIE